METIKLQARYGYNHTLTHVKDNLWILNPDERSGSYFRLIGFEGESHIGNLVYAIDPDGGPFLAVGDKIEGKTIKSITRNGFIELE